MAGDLKPDTTGNPPLNTPLPRATGPAAPAEAAGTSGTASAAQRASTFTAAGPCTPRRSVSLRSVQPCTPRDAISDTLAESSGAAMGGGAAEHVVFQATQTAAAAGADVGVRQKGRKRNGKARRAAEKRIQEGCADAEKRGAAAEAAKVERSSGSAPLRQPRSGKDGGGGSGKASSSGGGRGGGGGGTRSDRDGASERELKRPRFQAWQIDFLEESFLADYALEPDRKRALAAELGVQPRQVAVWFQNRRVRWKSRQKEADLDSLKGAYDELEDDCESLRSEYELLKGDYEELLAENSGLYSKILLLTRLVAMRDQGVEQAQSEQRDGHSGAVAGTAERKARESRAEGGVGVAGSECERSPMHSSGGSKAMQQALSSGSAGRVEWEKQPWTEDDGKDERETGRSGTRVATNTASTGTRTREGGMRRGTALSPLVLPACAMDLALPSPLTALPAAFHADAATTQSDAAGFEPGSGGREITGHGMQADSPPSGGVAVLCADFLPATHHASEPGAGMAALSRQGTLSMGMEGTFDAFTSLLTAPDELACEPYWPHAGSPRTHAVPDHPGPSPPSAHAQGVEPAGPAGVVGGAGTAGVAGSFSPSAPVPAGEGDMTQAFYPAAGSLQIEERIGAQQWEGAPEQVAPPVDNGGSRQAGEGDALTIGDPGFHVDPTDRPTSPSLPSPLSASTPLAYLPEPEPFSLPSLPAAATSQAFQATMAMPYTNGEPGSPSRSMMAMAAAYASPTQDIPASESLRHDLQLPHCMPSGDGSARKGTDMTASSPCTGAQGSGSMAYLPLVMHDDVLTPVDMLPHTRYTRNAEAEGAGPSQWHQSFNSQGIVPINPVNTNSGPYLPAVMSRQQQQQHEEVGIEIHCRSAAMQPLARGQMWEATERASDCAPSVENVHKNNTGMMEVGHEQIIPPATVHIIDREEGNSFREGMGEEMMLNNWWDGINS
ncbi:unnamed protein product [Closterium sp. Yama58-4]|nr:unnamed protein product [Closterium sp. Yama58-4]